MEHRIPAAMMGDELGKSNRGIVYHEWAYAVRLPTVFSVFNYLGAQIGIAS
jgi:hypothetical protein